MAKLSVQEIIDALKELSVMELNDLVTACEEEFGVSAAAGVAVVAAGQLPVMIDLAVDLLLQKSVAHAQLAVPGCRTESQKQNNIRSRVDQDQPKDLVRNAPNLNIRIVQDNDRSKLTDGEDRQEEPDPA